VYQHTVDQKYPLKRPSGMLIGSGRCFGTALYPTFGLDPSFFFPKTDYWQAAVASVNGAGPLKTNLALLHGVNARSLEDMMYPGRYKSS